MGNENYTPETENDYNYNPAQMAAKFTVNPDIVQTDQTQSENASAPQAAPAPGQTADAQENASAPEPENAQPSAETENPQKEEAAVKAADKEKPVKTAKPRKPSARKQSKAEANPTPAASDGKPQHALAINEKGTVILSAIARVPDESVTAVICEYAKDVGFDYDTEIYPVATPQQAQELITTLAQAWQTDMRAMGRTGIVFYSPDKMYAKVVDDNKPTCITEFKTAAIMRAFSVEKQIIAEDGDLAQSAYNIVSAQTDVQKKETADTQTDASTNQVAAAAQAIAADQPKADPVNMQQTTPQPAVQTIPNVVIPQNTENTQHVETQTHAAAQAVATAQTVPAENHTETGQNQMTQTVISDAQTASETPVQNDTAGAAINSQAVGAQAVAAKPLTDADRLVAWLMSNEIMAAQFMNKTPAEIRTVDKNVLDGLFRLQIERTRPDIIQQWYNIIPKTA